MKRLDETLLVLRFVKAAEGELPIDILISVLKGLDEVYKAALKLIIKGRKFDNERFGLIVAAWEPGSTNIGLVPHKPTSTGLLPTGDNGQELAHERALYLIMETWRQIEESREVSIDRQPIIEKLAKFASPSTLTRVGPIEVRMPSKEIKLTYNEHSRRKFKSFLKKPLTKRMTLLGKLMEADFRNTKETCLLIVPNLGQIKCKYPRVLEEKIHFHLHPLTRDVKVYGIAETDKTGRIIGFQIENITDQRSLFSREQEIREHLEPTDYKRFVGIMSDMPGEPDEIVSQLRNILWEDEET